MKKLILWLVACFLIACSSLTAPAAKEPASVVQPNPLDMVVALHGLSDDGIFCAGVWVGPRDVLTAAHCAVHTQDDGTIKVRDYTQVERVATVVKLDHDVDLALLTFPQQSPSHAFTSVATMWHVSEQLAVVGHPGGVGWVYFNGVLANDLHLQDLPEYLWISAPIWFGNSGGGAFDAQGRLVGIASKMGGDMPNMGLFVPPQVIEAFLATR